MSELNKARTTAVWQRGPVAGFPAEMQPAVHAFLDVIEECALEVSDLTHEQLWARPGGVASVGFHLMHVAGSTDRLISYAFGEALNDTQREYLKTEAVVQDASVTPAMLAARSGQFMRETMDRLRDLDPATYQEIRYVGRARIESTVWGLVFHAAEHAARHAGQLVTTSRVLRGMAADR